MKKENDKLKIYVETEKKEKEKEKKEIKEEYEKKIDILKKNYNILLDKLKKNEGKISEFKNYFEELNEIKGFISENIFKIDNENSKI